MHKSNKYLDVITLLVLCYTSCVAIYYDVSDVYVLSVSNYIGFGMLIAVIIQKLVFPDKFKLSIIALLSVGLFNIVRFTYYRSSAGVSIGNDAGEVNIINPLILVLLIVYLIVNRKFIKSYFTMSDAEIGTDQSKLVGFYYEKFNTCSSKEFEEAVSMYSEYPVEGQLALKKIQEERKPATLKL